MRRLDPQPARGGVVALRLQRWLLCGVAAAALLNLGPTCSSVPPPEGPPLVAVTLNAVSDSLNDLLIVPSDDFVINVSFTAGGAAVNPDSFQTFLVRWGDPDVTPFTASFVLDATGGYAQIGPAQALQAGSYTLYALVYDTEGAVGWTDFSFAVRARQGLPPIGTGQKLWYDFASDRDGVPGPDFPVDLETFGLGSPADPGLSAQVEAAVIDAILARVSEAYHQQDPVGFGTFDPVDVTLFSQDPGGSDVTRICIGGPDPSGGNAIGSILIDPLNSNRAGMECGTIPPTGIFPRAMTVYQSQSAFQLALGGLMPPLGGTPVGEDPLDAIVLAPGFDPGTASAPELARHGVIDFGIRAYADALGSIVAHETGHALGLVAPGPPGAGLYGGTYGTKFSHDVNTDGSLPAYNYLMKQGGTFNFARLAGLEGSPRPYFRPLDFAYLRDRVILDASITALLMPPTVEGAAPPSVSPPTSIQVTVTGSDFAAIPKMELVNESFLYQMAGVSFVDSSQVQGWVVSVQVAPGTYDLVLTNPDGQSDRLENAFTVLP
jgi:hypothetical protein